MFMGEDRTGTTQQFNVEIPADLHAECKFDALKQRITLAKWAEIALRYYLNSRRSDAKSGIAAAVKDRSRSLRSRRKKPQ